MDREKMDRFSAKLHEHEEPLRGLIRSGGQIVFVSPTRVRKDSTGRLVDSNGHLVTVEEGVAVYLDGEVFMPDSKDIVYVSLVEDGSEPALVNPDNRAVGELRPIIVVNTFDYQPPFSETRASGEGCFLGFIRYFLGI